MTGYARNSVGLRVLMAGIHYRDRRAIVESNSVICHEGIRGVNGTSFDSNIIITTTNGFDDLGVWRRPHDAHKEVPIQRQRSFTFTDSNVPEPPISETEVSPDTGPEPGHLTAEESAGETARAAGESAAAAAAAGAAAAAVGAAASLPQREQVPSPLLQWLSTIHPLVEMLNCVRLNLK